MAKVTLEIVADLKKATRDVVSFQKQTNKSLKKIESGFKTIGLAAAGFISVFAAQKISQGISGATTALGDFSTALAEVRSISNDTIRNNKELGRSLQEAAVQFGTSATAQAKTFYQIISAGITEASQAQKVLVASNKLAIGGLADVNSAVDILTTSLNVYKTENLTAAEASDALFQAVKLGKTTVPELASSLGNVLPVAKAVGVSFNDVAGTIAALTAKGIPSTAQAVTSLRSVFAGLLRLQKRLPKESKKIQKAFDLNALKTQNLAKFIKGLSDATGGSSKKMLELLGRQEALIGIQALSSDGFQTLTANIEAMKDSTGAANKAFEDISGSLGKQLSKLRANLGNLVLRFTSEGEGGLNDAVKGINESVIGLIKNFSIIKATVNNAFRIIAADILVSGNNFADLADNIGIAFKESLIFIQETTNGMREAILKIPGATRLLGSHFKEVTEESKDDIKELNKEIMILGEHIKGRADEAQQFQDDIEEAFVVAIQEANKFGQTLEATGKKGKDVSGAIANIGQELEDAAPKTDDIKKGIADLEKELKNAGLTQREIIRATEQERVKALEEALKENVISLDKFNELRTKIALDSSDKILKAAEARIKKETAEAKKAADDVAEHQRKVLSFAGGVISGGAKSAAAQALTIFGDTLGPGLGAIFGQVFQTLSQNTDDFKKQLDSMFSADFAKNIGANLKTAVKEFKNLAKPFVQGIIEALPDVASASLSIFTDPTFIANLALAIGEGFITGIANAVPAAAEKIKEGFINIFSAAGEGLLNVFTAVGTSLTASFGQISTGVSDATQKIEDAINAFPQAVGDAIAAIPGAIKSFVDGLTQAIVDFGVALPEAINSGINAFGEGIKAGIFAIGEAFKPENIAKFGESFGTAIDQGIADGINSFGEAGGDIAQTIEEAFTDAFNKVGEKLGQFFNFFEPIAAGFRKAGEELGDIFTPQFLKKGKGGKGGSFLQKIGFAEGGVVPPGFPNDSFDAGLSSGELVLPQRTTDSLFAAIEKLASASRQDDGAAQPEAGPGPLTIQLEIGEQRLADVILSLNRNGFRTA